jgi:hypothetical protein
MSSALPEPESDSPEFNASLRAGKPAEPTESPADSSPAPTRSGPSMGFVIGWDVFRILVWVTIAVWVNPDLLVFIGGEDAARWLRTHGWVRLLGVPPLGLLALISAFEVINDPRRHGARKELARGTGATLVELRGIDPTYGLPSGPGLRVPLGRTSMVVGTWKSQNKACTVASVRVEARTAFSFVARGPDREPAMLRGAQQLAMGHAMRRLANRADDPRAAAAAATLAYMADPPISTGHDMLDRRVVLRANHPDTARTLLGASAVTSAIVELDAKTRLWDWSLHATSAGRAEMRLECPGALDDAESLSLVRTLMEAALEELTRAGVLAE